MAPNARNREYRFTCDMLVLIDGERRHFGAMLSARSWQEAGVRAKELNLRLDGVLCAVLDADDLTMLEEQHLADGEPPETHDNAEE